MRNLLLAAFAAVLSAGLALAAEAKFVSYDKEKKELKVSEGKSEKTYKLTDKTTFKVGDKDLASEKAFTRLEKAKDGAKLDITADKDTATEIKFAAPKKDKDKSK